ncbi:hypothetical protein ACSDQ9_13135 [Aestuariimicrobium soli]|uniref:hypothetical protein n=1 Tax=Aestuariimicrobium soli TaxID=2035834 RepID=UPI003EB9B63E
MTNWSDLEDVSMTEEWDEYDPLAPMSMGSLEADSDAEDGDEFASSRRMLEDGSINYDKPFADPLGMVRVWIDADRAITKVRMSPNWRDRLPSSAGTGAEALTRAFSAAFVSINNVDRTETHTDGRVNLDGAEAEPATRPIAWDDLARLQRRSDQVMQRFDQLDDSEGHGVWHAEQAVGRAGGDKVVVTMDHTGRYLGITFDGAWLEGARVREVTTAVTAAAAEAKARVRPGTYEPGERDELFEELSSIRTEMKSLMKRGFH